MEWGFTSKALFFPLKKGTTQYYSVNKDNIWSVFGLLSTSLYFHNDTLSPCS